MKTISCHDMGVTCDFIAKGETEEEVIGSLMEHAKSAHADTVAEMQKTMSEEDIMNQMKSKIKEA